MLLPLLPPNACQKCSSDVMAQGWVVRRARPPARCPRCGDPAPGKAPPSGWSRGGLHCRIRRRPRPARPARPPRRPAPPALPRPPARRSVSCRAGGRASSQPTVQGGPRLACPGRLPHVRAVPVRCRQSRWPPDSPLVRPLWWDAPGAGGAGWGGGGGGGRGGSCGCDGDRGCRWLNRRSSCGRGPGEGSNWSGLCLVGGGGSGRVPSKEPCGWR